MPTIFERLADFVARKLLAWLSRNVHPEESEWIDALAAESACAEGGWQRLRWALGGLPLVWTVNRNHPVEAHLCQSNRSRVQPTASTAQAFVGWWVLMVATLLLFTHSRFSSPRGEGFVVAVLLVVLIGGALGVIVALALRARIAAYLWATVVACQGVELVTHWYFGFGTVLGAPTDLAIIAAGILGMVLTAATQDHDSVEATMARARSARGLLERLRLLRRVHTATATLFVGMTSFLAIELGVRAVFGVHPFGFDLTNFAILGAAMLAANLGALIWSYGDRLALKRIALGSGNNTVVVPSDRVERRGGVE
jgi:hypothetical protein